ncbi:hypothetical protein VNO77_33998 [Canavalia gladiata]|uniref:Uncharacterized protein n=1 Tax=Canavalia gladiata TaxID=3824 RepID=A0AAN9KEW0_CANGL
MRHIVEAISKRPLSSRTTCKIGIEGVLLEFVLNTVHKIHQPTVGTELALLELSRGIAGTYWELMDFSRGIMVFTLGHYPGSWWSTIHNERRCMIFQEWVMWFGHMIPSPLLWARPHMTTCMAFLTHDDLPGCCTFFAWCT